MSYHYNTHHLASMRAAHLLLGRRDERSVVAPSQVRRSAREAVHHDAIAWDVIAGMDPEVYGPVLVVRWSIQHRKNDCGSHILHQPRIVGFVPARNAGEPVHYIPWGTRARNLANAWRRGKA